MTTNLTFDGTSLSSTSSAASTVIVGSTGNLVIVGGTVAALMIALRTLDENNSTNVTMIVEGDNYLVGPDVDGNQFGDVAIKSTIVDPYQVVYKSDDRDASVVTINLPEGLCSEAIATFPSVVEQPPILFSGSSPAAPNVVRALTQEIQMTTEELNVVGRLATALNLNITRDIVTRPGSIYKVHYDYVENSALGAPRYVGRAIYNRLVSTFSARFNLYVNCRNISFANVQTDGTASVSFEYTNSIGNNPVTVMGRLLLRGNIYDNIRIATNGGLGTFTGFMNQLGSPGNTLCQSYPATNIPASYRAIYCIPVGGDVQSNQQMHFTAPVSGGYVGGQQGWIVDVYTMAVDLRTNYYAPAGKTLLIIEASLAANNRIIFWDSCRRAFVIQLNSNEVETRYASNFQSICQQVLSAYQISTTFPLIETATTPSGISNDVFNIAGLNAYMSNTAMLINECVALFRTSGTGMPTGI